MAAIFYPMPLLQPFDSKELNRIRAQIRPTSVTMRSYTFFFAYAWGGLNTKTPEVCPLQKGEGH